LQFYWLSGIVEKIYDIYMENLICNCKNSRRAVQQLEKLNALLWDECVRENEKESQAYTVEYPELYPPTRLIPPSLALA